MLKTWLGMLPDQALMASIASEVTARLGGDGAKAFSRQHLANLLWAFATLEVTLTAASFSTAHCTAV